MSAQELQVVKAFSSLTIPEDVIRNQGESFRRTKVLLFNAN